MAWLPLSNPALKHSNDTWLHVEAQGPIDQGHKQLMELVVDRQLQGMCTCVCETETEISPCLQMLNP